VKITITFPFFKKWKRNRKIKLTRDEAMIITAMLEAHRLSLKGEAWEQKQVSKAEDILDVQIWGKIRINGEWVKV